MRIFAVIVTALLATASSAWPACAADDPLSTAANQAFLAANAHKAGVITRPDGLQYTIVRGGGYGNRPAPEDSVQVQFSAYLINGTVFDGTSPGLPAILSVGGVLRGLSEALQMMHTGERWQVVVPANLAFGSRGSDNGAVPPNQTLVFDLNLLSVIPATRVAGAPGQMSIAPINRVQGTVHEEGAMLTIPQ